MARWGFGRKPVDERVHLLLASAAVTGDKPETFQVAVYSDNRRARAAVLAAIAAGPHSHVRIHCIEVATAADLQRRVSAGGIDLAILDAEATPVGGLGLTRQLKDEVVPCPPLVVLIRRTADDWLARWSQAEGTVRYPVDPVTLAEVVRPLLFRAAGGPAAESSDGRGMTSA
ncbi:hypothetical protein BH10ACT9_BH10ACT9_60600 [soil metagenome]